MTGYTSIDNIGTSLLLAVPAYTNVTFKGITFNNVMCFNYQLYTSPWSQLGERSSTTHVQRHHRRRDCRADSDVQRLHVHELHEHHGREQLQPDLDPSGLRQLTPSDNKGRRGLPFLTKINFTEQQGHQHASGEV